MSRRFEDLRAAFHLISDDPRAQAIIIAFCFGGLLEALAGFGAPVAITGVMLMALGFSPIRAAIVVLLANTAPVAFGAIGTPIITAGALTSIPYAEIGAYVGRQTPVLAFVVPLLLVLMVDGKRGVRQTWPLALSVGVTFAIAQFLASNYLSVELTDIVAALAGLVAAVVTLKVWTPAGGEEAAERLHQESQTELADAGTGRDTDGSDGGVGAGGGVQTRTAAQELTAHAADLTRGRLLMAFAPYLLVIAVFSVAKLVKPVSSFLSGQDIKIKWPGLDGNVLSSAGKPVTSTVYNFQWLSSPGSLLLICGFLVALIYRVPIGRALRELFATAVQLPCVPHRATVLACLRHEPVRPDDHHRHLDRRHRLGVRVPLAHPRLAGYRGHRLGHLGQRPVRDPAADRGAGGRTRPDVAGRGQHLRRRGRQDDQPPEPDHRRHGGRNRRPGVGPVPQDHRVERGPARGAVRADRPAVDAGPRVVLP